ncbi:MAG: GIY-YIG nuclease family protein [Chloroflexota bacterium]
MPPGLDTDKVLLDQRRLLDCQARMKKKRAYMAWMYILKCADGSYYVGSTKNLELRIAQHQSGKGARYTSRRLPVELVYAEEYERVADAYYREKQVQNWSRAKREALINGTPELLPALAKKKFDKKKLQEYLVGRAGLSDSSEAET